MQHQDSEWATNYLLCKLSVRITSYNVCYTKLLRIPAERNMVGAIPNWFSVRLQDNNILSFMTDWGDSRLIYTKDNRITSYNVCYTKLLRKIETELVVPHL